MIDYADLLSRYGSPLYIYDLAEIRMATKMLLAALPENCDLYYSLKANPCAAVVSELARLSCKAEVSSPGELQIALASGFAPAQCLYTGPGKSLREIEAVFQAGGCFFSVESRFDLEKISYVAQATESRAEVLLRVNVDQSVPGFGLAMTGVASPFGIDASAILKHPQAYSCTPWMSVIGFHFYMGSNTMSSDTLLSMFALSLDQAVLLAEILNISLKVLDLGGGFGHPFAKAQARPTYLPLRSELEALLTEKLLGWREGHPTLAFESGRYLVAGAGTLICTVQDVKVSKGTTFVVLDSGIHHLGGMSGLGRMFRVEPDILLPSTHSEDEHSPELVSLVGPLCTPLDIWSSRAHLSSVKPGDVIAIPNVGAYGLTASLLTFLSRECPVEVMVDGAIVHSASQLVVKRISC